MIEYIEISGCSGSGKTFRKNIIETVFKTAGIFCIEGGYIYENVNNDRIFDGDYSEIANFRSHIENSKRTLYIIYVCSPVKCQQRIVHKGDFIDEAGHTQTDLNNINKKYKFLYQLVKDLPNVCLINTTEDLNFQKLSLIDEV